MALAAWLGLSLFHADVSNAFQSTPDTTESTYIRCFPEYLEWVKMRHPEHYKELMNMYPDLKAHQLAMMMYKYVQGRTEASRTRKEFIEAVLIRELQLTPNRADSCLYAAQ